MLFTDSLTVKLNGLVESYIMVTYSLIECLKIINIQKGPPTDLDVFSPLPLSVVLSVCPMFGFIFSTMDLRRNLLIQ